MGSIGMLLSSQQIEHSKEHYAACPTAYTQPCKGEKQVFLDNRLLTKPFLETYRKYHSDLTQYWTAPHDQFEHLKDSQL
ncbi:hypothetical protein H5410_015177 [Solanum commersonii]|uniref:Uncharacterized protein n=1 Tax=Solanum commersonii TaxID=4109 RepID=A0A9J5ZT32_SOLCO|nr:hypothetical protein H5410_015177 [Solanum commersonii]